MSDKVNKLIEEFSNASMDWVKAPRHCPDKVKRYREARADICTAFEELEGKLDDALSQQSDAAQTIMQMQVELDVEKEKQQWISTENDLPPDLELVEVKGESVNEIRQGRDICWRHHGHWTSWTVTNIKYWRKVIE